MELKDYLRQTYQYNYIEVYNECEELLKSLKNDENIINEGLFGGGGFFAGMCTKLFGGKDSKIGQMLGLGAEGDDRTEYQKALEKAASDKAALKEKNRNELIKKRDSLKSAAVKAKSAAEKNQIELAHKEMTKALDAQIAEYQRQENMWSNNNIRMSDEELESTLKSYDDQINGMEGDNQKSEQKKKDLLVSMLYKIDDKTGEVTRRTPDEINELASNPEYKDVINELKDSYSVDAAELAKKSEDELNKMAQQFVSDVDKSVKEFSQAEIDKTENEIKEKEDKLSAVEGALHEHQEKQQKNKAKQDEVIANWKTKRDAENALKDIDKTVGDELNSIELKDCTSTDESGKDAPDPKKIQKLISNKYGVQLTNEEVGRIKLNDTGTGIEVPDDIKNKIKESKSKKLKDDLDKANAKLDSMEDDIKKNGLFENYPPKKDEELKPTIEPLPQDVQDALKVQYPNLDVTDPGAVSAHIEQEKADIKSMKEKLDKTKTEKAQFSESLKARRMAIAKEAARAQESNIDPEMQEHIEKSRERHVAGTVVRDGKEGYYDDNGDFKEKPNINDKAAREEWEKGRTKALLMPSKAQKKEMEIGSNQRIKMSGTKENPVYTVMTKNANGEWEEGDPVEKEEAYAIQAQYEKSKKNEAIQLHINQAAESGMDLNDLAKQYPELGIDKMNPDELKALQQQYDKQVLGDADVEDVDDGDKDASDGSDYDGEETDSEKEERLKNAGFTKGEDGKWTKDDKEATEDELKSQTKKITNPAKLWKRRKNKSTGKLTKSYYEVGKGKDANSISAKEYKEMMDRYKAAKAKASQKTKEGEPKQAPQGEPKQAPQGEPKQAPQEVNTSQEITQYMRDHFLTENKEQKHELSDFLKGYFK